MRESSLALLQNSSRALSLTEREKHVLLLISEGYSSTKIAQSLFVSFETIKSHRKNLMRKLDVPNTAALISTCFKQGILPII